MIGGRITNREAIVEIEVCGPEGSGQTVKAVVDTGYNGHVTFPDDLVESLQLSFAGHRRGMLADGNIIRLDVYLAQLIWHGHSREVLVSQAEGAPLIGMSLLEGSRMTMDVHEGGEVVIEEMPQGGPEAFPR